MAKRQLAYQDMTPAQQHKFRKVLREFAAGTLRHGSTGAIVRDKKVAQAIAFSEASKA